MLDAAADRPLTIGCAVCFTYKGETVHGHLLDRQGGRRYARVIDENERTWKVAEAALTATGRARLGTLVTRNDAARAAWRKGDRVTFPGRDGQMTGKIAKLNPKRAKVRCGATSWNVPYELLRGAGGEQARNGADRLDSVAAMARQLMDLHGLADWTLAFVEAGGRLGDCIHDDRVIRIARAHALDHREEQVRDTVLHEIAHALAGPEAGHGPQWKAIARRIGATPTARAHETELL